MLTPQSRPSFFPGQLLDFRDFNRLADQPERNAVVQNRSLFPGGGILLQSGEEFALRIGRELEVVVSSGVAILPSGEVLVSAKPLAIDLKSHLVQGQQILVVGIAQDTVATDLYTDSEDPSIQGYRTSSKQPKLVARYDRLEGDCLEIFRVVLTRQCRTLRMIADAERWMTSEVSPSENLAVIDNRFQRRIVPLSFSPIDFVTGLRLRSALYSMEDCLRRLQKIFLVEDQFECAIRLSMLHAEILSVPFQPLKASFALADYSEKLAYFLESISRKCQVDQPNFNREKFIALCGLLDTLRSRQAIPQALPFERIADVANLTLDFTVFAEQRYTLLNAVEQALGDLSDRYLDLGHQTTLAGRVFQRVDRVLAGDKDRIEFSGSDCQTRKLSTRYLNGDAAERMGVFLRDGKVSLDFQVSNTESPAVVWFPQHIRRRGAKVEYRVNGKKLAADGQSMGVADNIWRNRGLVIAPEALVPQGNRLTLKIDEADLDFGFFEMAVYQ